MFTALFDMAHALRSPWPVCYTHDTDDLSQANAYVSRGQYVWLVCESIALRDDFSLAWTPSDDQQFNIHAFPYCRERGKAVIRWDAVRLVPTDPAHRSYEVKQREIAAYDKNRYSIFFVSNYQPDAVKTYQTYKQRFPSASLIRDPESHTDMLKKIGRSLYSRYAWVIDIDMVLGSTVNLYFDPDIENNNSYVWDRSAAIDNDIMPYGVSLLSYTYITSLSNAPAHDFNIIGEEIGQRLF
jgi:hypothetical protein